MKFGSTLKVKAVIKNATETDDLAYIVETPSNLEFGHEQLKKVK